MKKTTSILLSLILTLTLICAAAADEVPQPENGKKFEGDWAVAGVLALIDYEEEGYRVLIDSFPEEGKGIEWSYNCLYREEDDALVSVSSGKQEYSLDPKDPGNKIYEPAAYEGFDDDGAESVFSIDENGRLHWKDGHENMGADLEFVSIGRFDGRWNNDAEGVSVLIDWDGRDVDSFFYRVVIQRASDNLEQLAVYVMNGIYNEETGKLECTGGIWSRNAGNQLETDGETYDAFFSMTDNGSILYETANGIELQPGL